MTTLKKSPIKKSAIKKATKKSAPPATKKTAAKKSASPATKKTAAKKSASPATKKVTAEKSAPPAAEKSATKKSAPPVPKHKTAAKKSAPPAPEKSATRKSASPVPKQSGAGKATNKKPPGRKSATGSTSDAPQVEGSTAPTHTWDELVRLAKPPTATEQALYAVQIAPDLLRGEGATVASDRILTDALRWGGTLVDFIASAPPELVREVRGFAPGLLRVFVTEGYRLYEMNQRFQSDKRVRSVAAKVDQAAATSSRKLAQSYRRQLFEAIKDAAQQDDTILRQLAEASGALDLSTALHQLVALARELASDRKSPTAQRLTLGGVDAAYLATIESQAEQADATGTRIRGPKKATPISQGELDVQDGACLALMERLMLLFAAARAINPKIPALTPNATRRYFYGHKQTPKLPTSAEPSPRPEA